MYLFLSDREVLGTLGSFIELTGEEVSTQTNPSNSGSIASLLSSFVLDRNTEDCGQQIFVPDSNRRHMMGDV